MIPKSEIVANFGTIPPDQDSWCPRCDVWSELFIVFPIQEMCKVCKPVAMLKAP